MGGGSRLNEATKLVQLLLALQSSPLFGCVFDCWVIIIVGLSLSKFSMAIIAYCMGKRTIRTLMPLGTEVL